MAKWDAGYKYTFRVINIDYFPFVVIGSIDLSNWFDT
jgi:hypothetical protein